MTSTGDVAASRGSLALVTPSGVDLGRDWLQVIQSGAATMQTEFPTQARGVVGVAEMIDLNVIWQWPVDHKPSCSAYRDVAALPRDGRHGVAVGIDVVRPGPASRSALHCLQPLAQTVVLGRQRGDLIKETSAHVEEVAGVANASAETAGSRVTAQRAGTIHNRSTPCQSDVASVAAATAAEAFGQGTGAVL